MNIPFSIARSGIGCQVLSIRCPLLEKLNIGGCCLSNKDLQFLLNFTNLKSLNLARTKIADITMINIVRKNPKLVKVNLLRCKRITQKAVLEILQKEDNLRYLNVFGTKVNKYKGCKLLRQCVNYESDISFIF